jgi:hypothetical protein
MANKDRDTREIKGSTIESVNAILATSRGSVRYMNPETMMCFLTFRCAFLNLISRWKSESGSNDSEDADLVPFANRIMPCGCNRCEQGRASDPLFVAEEARVYGFVAAGRRRGLQRHLNAGTALENSPSFCPAFSAG